MDLALGLRPSVSSDRPFLLSVFASTREAELALLPLSGEQKALFAQTQFDAQMRHYQLHFGQADSSIILLDGAPIGRLIVDRRPEVLHLLDIALLPQFRRNGIGTELLRQLAAEAEATGTPIRLEVMPNNAARDLYERLGYSVTRQMGAYVEMERRCAISKH